MAEVGQLRASLSANSVAFETDMRKARDAVRANAKGMEAAMLKVRDAFTDTITNVNKLGGYAAVAAAGGIAHFIKKQIDAADEMGKLATKTGVTTEYLSSMALVADQSGVSMETFGKYLTKLASAMDDAKKGTGTARDTFESLGISMTDLGKGSDFVTGKLADKMQELGASEARTAAISSLLGEKVGPEMLKALDMGSAGIDDMRKKAGELGLVIGTEAALEAANFNDQLDMLQQTVTGTARSLGLKLVPWLNDTFAAIAQAKEESGALKAVWVALGAVGDAIFSKPLKKQISEAQAFVDEMVKIAAKAEANKDSFLGGGYDYKVAKKALAEAQANLKKLTDEQAALESDAKAAAAASLKRQQDDADAHRKNTEAMIAQSEARLKNKQLAAQAAADEKKRRADLIAEKKAIDDHIAALNEQSATFGLSKEQADMYALSLKKGVTQAQIEAAAAAWGNINAQEASAKAAEDAAIATEKQNAARRDAIKTANGILADIDPIIKANAEWQKLLDLQAVLGDQFPLTAEQMGQAYAKAMGGMKEEADQMTIFAEQAGKNIQDAFASFLFDPFKGGVNGMLDDFTIMLRKMAAQALASQILGAIGSWGSTGGGAGTTIGGIVGSVFGGKRENGGMVAQGTSYLVGERGPEIFTPSQTGNIAPNHALGGVTVVNNFNISQPADRRTQDQIAAMAGASIQRAMARGG